MTQSKKFRILTAVAICSAVFLAPSAAISQEKSVAARKGYMKLVGGEAGPLFGMAKGKMAYDAESAKLHAANLKALADFKIEGYFPAGTSSEDMAGKTRSLPAVWSDSAGFAKAFGNWRAAIDNLQNEAGKGQKALAAAVGAMGKSCGGCHKPFRAKKS